MGTRKKEYNVIQNKGLHVSHIDADGVGCVVVTNTMFPSVNFENHFCSLGEHNAVVNAKIDEWESGEDIPEVIFITDLCCDEETCERLNEFVINVNNSNKNNDSNSNDCIFLYGIDHHKTNMFLTKYNWIAVSEFLAPCFNLVCINDENVEEAQLVSATYLTFRFCSDIGLNNDFYNHEDVPYIRWGYFHFFNFIMADENKLIRRAFEHFVRDISRYDTWNWKNMPENTDGIEEYYALVCKAMGPKALFNDIMNAIELASSDISRHITNTGHLLSESSLNIVNINIQNRKYVLEKVPSFIKLTTNNDYIVAMFIHNSDYDNAICEKIYNSLDFVDYVEVIYPSNRAIGLRTKKETVDVSRITKRLYNGGGHQKAAGAHDIPVNDFLYDHMLTFYENSMTLDEFCTLSEEREKLSPFEIINGDYE